MGPAPPAAHPVCNAGTPSCIPAPLRPQGRAATPCRVVSFHFPFASEGTPTGPPTLPKPTSPTHPQGHPWGSGHNPGCADTRGAPRGWSPLRPVPGGTSGPTMPCPGHYRGLPVGLVPWVRSRPPTSAGPPAWTREPKPRVRVGSALISDLQRIPWTPGQGARGPGRCGPLRRHPRGGEAHAWSARWAWLPSAPCPAPPPRPVNRGD